ncbi:LOW QUALITY PROTEIN: Cation_ATPase_C domain-containing protein, partial [Cephalotus follicularis]
VCMVTTDNLQTARVIALECGILKSGEEAAEPNLIEGAVFRAYSDIEKEEIAGKISACRSSPNDKLLLVQALKRMGHVVGVTRDGTNDGTVLLFLFDLYNYKADIGLSMGIEGTEVAKQSSDIIILDDNFASVVKVSFSGRSIFANILNFIQFQLTVNVVALIINLVSTISSGDVPLNAVQLLWVNLIMDNLGALTLATEPATDQLVMPRIARVNPHDPTREIPETLITNIMRRNLLIQVHDPLVVLLVLNFRGESMVHLNNKQKNPLIFNAFVLCQIFNEFNAQKPDEKNVFKGITKNRLFMGIVAVTVVLQVIIIEFPGKFASTVRLTWSQWLISIGIAYL